MIRLLEYVRDNWEPLALAATYVLGVTCEKDRDVRMNRSVAEFARIQVSERESI